MVNWFANSGANGKTRKTNEMNGAKNNGKPKRM
jgi:hypothetical protein